MSGHFNGTVTPTPADSSLKTRVPRRIVRVAGDETGPVAVVLASFEGADIVGSKLHAEVQKLADQYRGEFIALEWLGKLGWVRYVTCRK